MQFQDVSYYEGGKKKKNGFRITFLKRSQICIYRRAFLSQCYSSAFGRRRSDQGRYVEGPCRASGFALADDSERRHMRVRGLRRL